MNYIRFISAIFILIYCIIISPYKSFARTYPKEKLPSYIHPLTEVGQRAEWSLDGQKVMYITHSGGDVFEIDVQTGIKTAVTQHYERPESFGYYRAMFLVNGDYLLTGGPGRHEAYLQIMDKSLTKPPVVFDLIVREGPAVSRKQLKIAWTQKQEKIWIADIVYKNGIPELTNKKLIIDNKNVVVNGIKYEGMVEPQNFRPPLEKELIWAQYDTTEKGIFTSEVFGYDLKSGEIVNYSKAPNQYDEPEGIFPDGGYTLVECDKHNPLGTSKIDLYRLKLDGTGKDYIRLTFFSDTDGFRASNPVVSDDGRFIAFQESRSDSPPGAGEGIYIFDLVKAGLFKK